MARQRTPTRRKGDDRDRRPKKKISILDQERVDWIDYKDVNLLRRFMSERAKIRARRVTGNDAQQQRAVARAIRIAREMALLPYSVRQVTHRNKGKGRDRGDRGELSAAGITAGAPGAPTVPPPRGDGAPPDGAAEAPEVDQGATTPPADPPAADAEVVEEAALGADVGSEEAPA